MSEEMQLALEHTLKTMRELKEAKAEIERLRAALEKISLMDKVHEHDLFSATCVARAALAEEKPNDR